MERNEQCIRQQNNTFIPSNCTVYTSAHSEDQSVYPIDYRQYPGYVSVQQTGMPYPALGQSGAVSGIAPGNSSSVGYTPQLQHQFEEKKFSLQYLPNESRTTGTVNTTLRNQREDVSASNETIGNAGVENRATDAITRKLQSQNGHDPRQWRSSVRKEVNFSSESVTCSKVQSIEDLSLNISNTYASSPERTYTIFSRENDRKKQEYNQTIIEKVREHTKQSTVHGEVDFEPFKVNIKEEMSEDSCVSGHDVHHSGEQKSLDTVTVADNRESGTESPSDAEEPDRSLQEKNETNTAEINPSSSNKVKSPKKYICNTCQKVTKSVRALERHQNLHTGKYACETCKKFCNSEKSLEQHYKIHQGYVGNNVCNVCDKTFYDKSSLNKHTLSVHMGITNHQCPHCERSFYARKTYEEHVRVHTGERPYKCDICPKSYKRISDLNHHVRLHKGETKHTCECCGEGFRRISELNRHMQKHKSAEEPEKSSRLHTCEWCYLVFNNLNDINDHVKTHIEERLLAKQNLVEQIVDVLDNSRLTESQQAFEELNQKLKDEERERDILMGLHEGACSTQSAVRKNVIKSIEAEKGDLQDESSTTDVHNGCSRAALNNGRGLSKVVNNETGKTVLNISVNIPVSKLPIEAGKSTQQGTIIELKKKVYPQTSEVKTVNAMTKNMGSEQSPIAEEEMTIKMEVDSDNYDDAVEGFQNEIDYGSGTECEDYNYGSDTECEDYDTLKLNLCLDKKIKVEHTRKKPKTNKRLGLKKKNVRTMKRKTTTKGKLHSDDFRAETEIPQMDQRKTNIKQKPEQSSFICEECGKVFPRRHSFLQHMNLHSGVYSCDKCLKTFATQMSLSMHMDNHEGKKVKEAKCNVCEKVYYDQSSLNKHVKNVHMNMKPFACTHCDGKFSENKTLVEHMRVHTGERPFTCQECGQAFKRQSEMNFHIKKHTGEIKLRCTVCGHGCRRQSELRKHMIIKHTGDKPFKCNLCERSYMSNGMLKEHIITHTTVKNFECERCGKGFHTQSKLDKHMKIKTDCTKKAERKNGMYECKFCFMQFYERHELEQHVEETHEKGAGIVMFSCKVCCKEFGRRQALKRHLKIHAGIRDYKCDQCGASFTQKHHLSQHERTHTGEKPFQCHICLKSFAQNATLYSHLKHH